MQKTDINNLVNVLICDSVRQGITDPRDIIEHIAETYIFDGKEIVVKHGKSNKDSAGNDRGSDS